MRKPVIISFTKEELDNFILDKSSCVTIINNTYSLPLYPYHLSNVSASIKRLLNAKVAKYDQRLEGIFLGYKNLKLITPYAAIRADSCYIHVDIVGDFYIFKPVIGAKLTGVVNKTSKNHIGCLVHKVFNVSVPNKNESESWFGFHLNIGDNVDLTVTKTQLDARLPYIVASIIPNESNKKLPKHKTTYFDDESLTLDDDSPKKHKKKKRHSDQTNNIEIETTLNDSPKMHKKKKRNSDQTNVEIDNLEIKTEILTQDTLILNDSLKKQKKKKRHSNQINGEIDNIEVKMEDLSQATTILNDSSKKQKKKKQHSVQFNDEVDNSETLETENVVTPKKKKLKENIIANTNDSEDFVTPKNKKKNKCDSEAPIEVEKDSMEDFVPKEKKKKKRNSDKHNESLETTIPIESSKKKKRKQTDLNELDVEALRNSLLNNQLQTLKETKKEKKRKSKEIEKPTVLSPIKPMADLEDRKTKKRKSSITTQNVVWDNKELNLYDSDLEKTLKTPSEVNNTDLEKSLQFNLAKITALNDDTPRKRKRESESDVTEVVKKKKSRKSKDL